MKLNFSKWMIIADYFFMIILVILSMSYPEISTIAISWTAQLAVSTGFYYWKAKNENRIKIPVEIIRSLSKEEKADVDLTQVITTIIEKD